LAVLGTEAEAKAKAEGYSSKPDMMRFYVLVQDHLELSLCSGGPGGAAWIPGISLAHRFEEIHFLYIRSYFINSKLGSEVPAIYGTLDLTLLVSSVRHGIGRVE